MHVCMCARMYACIYTQAHTSLRTPQETLLIISSLHLYACKHGGTHLYVCMYVCICMYICVYTHMQQGTSVGDVADVFELHLCCMIGACVYVRTRVYAST